MSPEQTRGKPLDKRAATWAFCGVLYEVPVGQPAFLGDDVTEYATVSDTIQLVPTGAGEPRVLTLLVTFEYCPRPCVHVGPRATEFLRAAERAQAA